MFALAITLIAVAFSAGLLAGCTWQAMHSTPTPQRRRPIVWSNN